MNKFITFTCNGQSFAIPIDSIEKILLLEQPALIPDTSDYIGGYLSYNGNPLVLIDMNRRLFKKETIVNEQTKVMVVHWHGNRLGLVVEAVTSVQEFYPNADQVEKEVNDDNRYLIETFRLKDAIILHIDIEKMFTEKGEAEILALLEK